MQEHKVSEDCQLTTTTGHHRLSNITTCEMTRTHTSLVDWSFTVAGLHLWKNIPLHLHDSWVAEDAPV